MKFAFCLFVLFIGGCKIQEGSHLNSRDDSLQEVSAQQKGYVRTVFENGVAKITAFFQVFDPPSAFCRALLENSPTRDDYIRNWQPNDQPNFCPGGAHILESCQKKHNDAFEAGLMCYKTSSEN